MPIEPGHSVRILNRDIIKYIAMLTMLLNHIAQIFMEPGTLSYEICLNIGYFTAVTMCYFLVEGYGYTHSKKTYALRLLIFAALSEIPFCMAFTEKGQIKFAGMNMLFTLFLCFVIILVMDKAKEEATKVIVTTLMVLLSSISDWAFLAPVFTILFIKAGKSQTKKRNAFLISMLLFGGFNLMGGWGRLPISTNLLYALGSMAGIFLAIICILCLYNGRRMQKGKVFSKWFFYLFYPVHLFILGLMRMVFQI